MYVKNFMFKLFNVFLGVIAVGICDYGINNMNIHASIPATYYNESQLKQLGFNQENEIPKRFWGNWYNAEKDEHGAVNSKHVPFIILKSIINNHMIKRVTLGDVYNTKHSLKYLKLNHRNDDYNFGLRINRKMINARILIGNKYKNVKVLPVYEGREYGLWYLSVKHNRLSLSDAIPNKNTKHNLNLPNKTTMTTWYYRNVNTAKKHYRIY
ncbi:hypothetical protein [Apilactobacillus timberlakei]|uniref:Uncharacterized protein n=1 Tax=Apilactobacillus timberlakei TaxID=2008380 RepID=A0ABY2YRJ7_9LACO|nr:hypothetical protein [Apilactobacillus timberlakei]TPR12377.1 hypothetical protein DYZ97_06945 [Apilactobacillus timberlakei]TPR12886.1 hypothetical protein DY048_06860 [Apilactobacillus timberlakei]TPR14436.1 hypothetical protein DY052_07365 [Apilactobacillus timberlakei]